MIGDRARFAGYLDHSVRQSSASASADRDAVLGGDASPYVLCAVGGGRDGAEVCEAFVRTRLPPGHRGILVTGSQMPLPLQETLRRLVARRSDMTLLPFVREPIGLMAGAARIVAMGGYNTTCEILSLRRPALIVPRARPRAEQLIRAERLAERGLIAMLHPDQLSPATLGAWLAGPVPVSSGAQPDMNGLDRVRAFTDELLMPAEAPARAS